MPDTASLNTADTQALLARLAEEVRTSLSPRLEKLFAAADDSLFNTASRARSNNEQTKLFESLREIRARNGTVRDDFLQRLTDALLSLPQPKPPERSEAWADAANFSATSLELIADEEMEKRVAIIDIVKRARQEHQEALYQAGERMQVLAGRSLEPKEVPLDPMRITLAFVRASEPLDIPLDIRKLLYQQFDLHLIRQLKPVYEAGNRLLSGAGILPDLAPMRRQMRKEDPRTPGTPSDSRGAPNDGPAATNDTRGVPPAANTSTPAPQIDEARRQLAELRSTLGVRNAPPATQASADAVWESIRATSLREATAEPVLASFLHATILNHATLEAALSFHLAQKLDSPTAPALLVREVIEEAFAADPGIGEAIRRDLRAVQSRDSACPEHATAFLFFKGFHALQSYRIAHWLWRKGRRSLALFLQNRISCEFGVDIHPAARIGCGILLDHATGVVIGETAVIGDDVSIMQSVTLGGTGKESGDRHPKVGSGVLIGAGAKILGNIRIGDGAKISAGSVVLADVPEHTTVAGVPARVVGRPSSESPALDMNHALAPDIRNLGGES